VLSIAADLNDGNGNNSGHVHVYSWNVSHGEYTQQGFNIDGEAGDDHSGSVSLSNDGSVLAIGERKNDGIGYSDSGHVCVYS
jgi:hypothetical protein